MAQQIKEHWLLIHKTQAGFLTSTQQLTTIPTTLFPRDMMPFLLASNTLNKSEKPIPAQLTLTGKDALRNNIPFR